MESSRAVCEPRHVKTRQLEYERLPQPARRNCDTYFRPVTRASLSRAKICVATAAAAVSLLDSLLLSIAPMYAPRLSRICARTLVAVGRAMPRPRFRAAPDAQGTQALWAANYYGRSAWGPSRGTEGAPGGPSGRSRPPVYAVQLLHARFPSRFSCRVLKVCKSNCFQTHLQQHNNRESTHTY